VKDAISNRTIQEDLVYENVPIRAQTSRPFNIASAKDEVLMV
jgi:hypothetical protein